MDGHPGWIGSKVTYLANFSARTGWNLVSRSLARVVAEGSIPFLLFQLTCFVPQSMAGSIHSDGPLQFSFRISEEDLIITEDPDGWREGRIWALSCELLRWRDLSAKKSTTHAIRAMVL